MRNIDIHMTLLQVQIQGQVQARRQVKGQTKTAVVLFFVGILHSMVLLVHPLSLPLSSSTPPSPSPSPSPSHSNISGAEKLRQLFRKARGDGDNDNDSNDNRSRNRNRSRSSSRSSIVLPGIHDALSAKIFADAGAQALFLSGFGVSASKLGQPDVGLLTQTEMEDTIRSVVQAISTSTSSTSSSTSTDSGSGSGSSVPPLIVDADTGFGGPLNIRRTIRGFASAGAAAVTIEDQKFPKKCTYAAGTGVRVVSTEECRARVEVAIAARNEARDVDGNDILVVARTDCRAAMGLEEAVERCKMFESVGADICYAENLQSREEYEYLRERLDPSTITMLAQVQLFPSGPGEGDHMGTGGDSGESGDNNFKQVLFNADEIGEMGYDLALYGVTPLQSVVYALKKTAGEILDTSNGGPGLVTPRHDVSLTPFSELKEAVGFPDAEKFESLYE